MKLKIDAYIIKLEIVAYNAIIQTVIISVVTPVVNRLVIEL